MNPNLNTDGFYTVKNVEVYANRMHINTLLEIVINGLAVYIILKHSTTAMGIYKYYILSTIISAFLMDFNISFIFAPFPIFPSAILCSAGIITRNLDWIYGEVFPYFFMHFTLSFVGLSIFYGYLYQYYSLTNRLEKLNSFRCTLILTAIAIIYPIPCVALLMLTLDRQGFLNDVTDNLPDLYHFLVNELPCNGLIMNKKTYFYAASILVEIIVLSIGCWYLGYKILKKLHELKSVLSSSTLRAKKQYLLSLSLQMVVPVVVIIVPIFVLVLCVIFNISQLKYMAPYFFQILALHSCFNALLVIFVITPYRRALLRMIPFKRSESVTTTTHHSMTATDKNIFERKSY